MTRARGHFGRAVTLAALSIAAIAATSLAMAQQSAKQPATRAEYLAAMKRATTFMVEKVANQGGYVWAYLPDLSRRWGEIEARASMMWIQPPGTATMGQLYLDAYHATGDEYYYQAAERTTGAVIWGQLPSGGWNYVADFAGEQSLREWYRTVGKNAWRLEEFQHYWGNATFDDVTTVDAARLLLRIYLEKRDPKYRPALDKAIQFILDSQYPIGGWPQRYPANPDFIPDYTSFITFNDDVAAENIDFLLQCYQTLGESRLLDPVLRGMQAFLVLQGGAPQPGWALQYTRDYKPAGARTYEPNAIVTHTSARNVELLIRFYRLTGDTRFLARVPEAIDWLQSVTSPAGIAPSGRTHPTFVEVGTNKPLYVHREGANVGNGRYFFNYDPAKTIGHYSAFRRVDIAGLRKQYQDAKALAPKDATRGSPLVDPSPAPLPKYFALDPAGVEPAAEVIAGLNTDGAWITALEYMSHPYRGDAPTTPSRGDFATTHVGDEWDTSPFPNTTVQGISTAMYIRRMSALIRALESTPAKSAAAPIASPVTWRIDNLRTIGGHAVATFGAPKVVPTPHGPAVEFNGTSDGLVVDHNPLQGLRTFTIEAELEPADDGAEEQRFLHVAEDGTENRVMVETRMAGRRWCLDSFMKFGDSSLTLIDRTRTHDAGRWHTAAVVFDGTTMSHFVDGVLEASGPVAMKPLGPGRVAVGMRLNQISWFKGKVRLVRMTPSALAPSRLLKPNRA